MKKIVVFSLAAIGIIGCVAVAKALKAPKPKPTVDDNICYVYSVVENDCVGTPTNCLCNYTVPTPKLSQLNAAIANNTISDFFSSGSNIQAFGLYPDQAQELTSSSCWVLMSTNQQAGKVFYAVGTAAVQSFENADFVMNITPSSN